MYRSWTHFKAENENHIVSNAARVHKEMLRSKYQEMHDVAWSIAFFKSSLCVLEFGALYRIQHSLYSGKLVTSTWKM